MAIISCPKCGHSVSSEAVACPKCNLGLQSSMLPPPSEQKVNYLPQQQNHVNASVPSIGEWMLYQFVVLIPLVGLILLIVWALDKDNLSRKNWAAAILIWQVIILFIIILFWVVTVSAVVGAFN